MAIFREMVIYCKEEKVNGLTVFYGNFSDKSMQNYHKIYSQKGIRVIYPDSMVTENG